MAWLASAAAPSSFTSTLPRAPENVHIVEQACGQLLVLRNVHGNVQRSLVTVGLDALLIPAVPNCTRLPSFRRIQGMLRSSAALTRLPVDGPGATQ